MRLLSMSRLVSDEPHHRSTCDQYRSDSVWAAFWCAIRPGPSPRCSASLDKYQLSVHLAGSDVRGSTVSLTAISREAAVAGRAKSASPGANSVRVSLVGLPTSSWAFALRLRQ